MTSAFFPGGAPQNYVDGAWSVTRERTDCIDPSTGEAYTSAPLSDTAEVDAAVAAAERAQPAWAGLNVAQRAQALATVRTTLAEHAEELAFLESVDSGNPLASTRRDMQLADRYLRDWPSHAVTRAGKLHRSHPDGLALVTDEPYGVVGRIIAYNHPSLFAIAGSIFPLLAGNTIVVKAAAQTPIATLALGALYDGLLPPGVMNLVAGHATAGDALAVHPRIKRLAFTGSGATALKIQSRLSESGLVKHFTAELGGKNPMIVCPDVDIDAAADAALAGSSFLISQGQSCQSTARFLVHEDIHDAFLEALTERLAGIRIGKAYEERSDMGPLVSTEQLDRVTGFIRNANARLICGGGRPEDPPRGGYYLEPTLFADVPDGSALASEEIFGPIAVVQRWRTERQVVRMANDVPLGLSAAVWCKDIDRALRLSSDLHAGYIWVNDANRHYPGAPFGGQKASGTGREEAAQELASYSETKSINIKIAGA